MKKKKLIIGLIIILVVLALCVAVVFFLKDKHNSSLEAKVFSVNDISYEYYNYEETLSGNVTASRVQNIYLTSDKIVKEVYVTEGQEVKIGDVLLEYDTTSLQLGIETKRTEVDMAAAAVSVAQVELTRLQNTVPVEPTTEAPTTEAPVVDPLATPSDSQAGGGTQTTVEDDVTDGEEPSDDVVTYTRDELNKAIIEKNSEIERLKIEYQLQEVQYQVMLYQAENGKVLSTYNGEVTLLGEQEDCILNSTPFITVSGSSGCTVQSYIGENDIGTVVVGDTATLFSYETGMSYSGVITEISDLPSENYSGNYGFTETFYPMTISIEDADDLTQYSYLDVTLDTKTELQTDGYYMELAFAVKENGQYYVLVENNNKLEKRYIKTGKIRYGSEIQILGGLTRDEYIAFPFGKTAKEGVKTKHASYNELGF